jgi:hypothetical protein
VPGRVHRPSLPDPLDSPLDPVGNPVKSPINRLSGPIAFRQMSGNGHL